MHSDSFSETQHSPRTRDILHTGHPVHTASKHTNGRGQRAELVPTPYATPCATPYATPCAFHEATPCAFPWSKLLLCSRCRHTHACQPILLPVQAHACLPARIGVWHGARKWELCSAQRTRRALDRSWRASDRGLISQPRHEDCPCLLQLHCAKDRGHGTVDLPSLELVGMGHPHHTMA